MTTRFNQTELHIAALALAEYAEAIHRPRSTYPTGIGASSGIKINDGCAPLRGRLLDALVDCPDGGCAYVDIDETERIHLDNALKRLADLVCYIQKKHTGAARQNN